MPLSQEENGSNNNSSSNCGNGHDRENNCNVEVRRKVLNYQVTKSDTLKLTEDIVAADP